jgi:hypothetical protein
LEYLETSEFLEFLIASEYSEKNSKNNFKNLENLEQFFLMLGVFFFKKQKFPWKFDRGRKIEGARSSVIRA